MLHAIIPLALFLVIVAIGLTVAWMYGRRKK